MAPFTLPRFSLIPSPPSLTLIIIIIGLNPTLYSTLSPLPLLSESKGKLGLDYLPNYDIK